MMLKERFADYKRVLRIARKPGKDEFTRSAKVTSLGLLIIGGIGFAIFLGFVSLCGMLGVCL